MASKDEWDELDEMAQFLGYQDIWDFLATAPAELWQEQ